MVVVTLRVIRERQQQEVVGPDMWVDFSLVRDLELELGPLSSLLVGLDLHKLLGLELLGLKPLVSEVLSGSDVIGLGASRLDAVAGVIGAGAMHWLNSIDIVCCVAGISGMGVSQ